MTMRSCDSEARLIEAYDTVTVTLHELLREKTFASHQRGKHWARKVKQGDEQYRDTGEWRMIRRVVDKQNRTYTERIVDPRGNVIQQRDESLSAHQGHGSACKGRSS